MKRWQGDLEGILFPRSLQMFYCFASALWTPLVLCAQSCTLEEDNLWHKYSWTDLVLLTQQCIVLLAKASHTNVSGKSVLKTLKGIRTLKALWKVLLNSKPLSVGWYFSQWHLLGYNNFIVTRWLIRLQAYPCLTPLSMR